MKKLQKLRKLEPLRKLGSELIPHRSTAWVAVLDDLGFTLGQATYGERGYAPFKPENRPLWDYPTYDAARSAATELNNRVGVSPEIAILIEADSMGRSYL